jgi:hypothetical protein
MPYRTNHDLPAPIRRRLPPHAKTFTVRLSITLLQHTLAMHATRRQRIASPGRPKNAATSSWMTHGLLGSTALRRELRLLANQLLRRGKADMAWTSRKCLLLTRSRHRPQSGANRSCAASRIERSELGLDLSQCAASDKNAERLRELLRRDHIGSEPYGKS